MDTISSNCCVFCLIYILLLIFCNFFATYSKLNFVLKWGIRFKYCRNVAEKYRKIYCFLKNFVCLLGFSIFFFFFLTPSRARKKSSIIIHKSWKLFIIFSYLNPFDFHTNRQQILGKWKFTCQSLLCTLDAADPVREKQRGHLMKKYDKIT